MGFYFVFFFKQKTAYEVRISDWSSDVCSSDLVLRPWQFGVYGVYLFFTISGFVILPSVLRYSTGQFALRRFLRLYPLFLTLTLLFVLLNAVTNANPDLNNWPTILAGVTFTNLFWISEERRLGKKCVCPFI